MFGRFGLCTARPAAVADKARNLRRSMVFGAFIARQYTSTGADFYPMKRRCWIPYRPGGLHRLDGAHHAEAGFRIFSEFLKTSLLHEPSLIEHENLIRILQRADAMRNDQHGAAAALCRQSFHDQLLRRRIE